MATVTEMVASVNRSMAAANGRPADYYGTEHFQRAAQAQIAACRQYADIWFLAMTAQGEYVESSTDLDRLIALVREVICPQNDCTVTAGNRVVAVVCGDGRVVRVWDVPAAEPVTETEEATF